MAFEGEAKKLLHRLRENCQLLAAGWDEGIEYKVPVAYHGDNCEIRARTSPACTCPVVNETRKRKVKRPGLLQQLKDFQRYQDTDREPKAERGAPRVKTPKCHPELKGFFALDEITADVYTVVDRALEEAGRDRSWAVMSVGMVISELPDQAAMFVESRPDVARTLLDATNRWVATARRALRLTVSDAMLDGTVCGNCGGGLATPWDNSGDVRCVGTPSEQPCGETYPMSEWISLYEGSRRAQ